MFLKNRSQGEIVSSKYPGTSTMKLLLVERLTDRLKTALKEIRRTFRCNSAQRIAQFMRRATKNW